MVHTPYQPLSGYGYAPAYQPYIPPRFDAPQQPQNAVGASTVPAPVSGPPAPQAGFLCRPVTSREEALAVQADYFTPGTLMPDLGHGVVYLKRFNPNTGASDLFEFALVQDAAEPSEKDAPAAPSPQKILEAINIQLDSLVERIDDLAVKMEQAKPKPAAKKGGGEE